MEPLDRRERRQRGAWYTPPPLARFLVEQAVGPALAEWTAARAAGLLARPLRVVDPACGDGRLLAAAATLVSDHAAPGAAGVDTDAGSDRAGVELVGMELDRATAETAARALPHARIVAGDGRTFDPGGHFDAVVGNPPFLGQLARATARGGRSPLGGGPYADVAAEFLVRAVGLARPDGGRVALVLPQSVLSTRDTAPIRAMVAAEAAVTGFWWAAGRAFDAAVNVCVVVLQRGGAPRPVRRWKGATFNRLPDAPPEAVRGPTWAPLISDAAGLPSLRLDRAHGRLGDLASATAGFRQHFYGVIPFVGDDRDGPALVTSGLIDAGRCAWGERPARFAKQTFEAPRLDLAALTDADSSLGAWYGRQLAPKVLVATQTRVIEAVVDADGAWVPSVPVVAVHPLDLDDLWRVGAVLLAPPVAAWAANRYLGAGLGVTALKLSAAQVLGIPLPSSPWDDAAQSLRNGDVDGAAVRMCRAYGLGGAEADALLAWWRDGLCPRRSTTPAT